MEGREGAAKTVSDGNPLVARICRWAPYAPIHEPEQEQLPKRILSAPGNVRLTHPTAALSALFKHIQAKLQGFYLH